MVKEQGVGRRWIFEESLAFGLSAFSFVGKKTNGIVL
jgi:hypothetical protein